MAIRVPVATFSHLALISLLTLLTPPSAAAARSKASQQPGSASTSVSVAALRQILARDKHQSDGRIARQIARLDLGERMSDSALDALQSGLPGPKSRSALVALADSSAFLPPPAADILQQPPPGPAARSHMLSLTLDYLHNVIPKLPDFYADETIVRYEDRSRRKSRATSSGDRPRWHELAVSSLIVSYRDGKEVVHPRGWMKIPLNAKIQGLTTSGIFGPILSIVIIDAAHGVTTWKRWEHGSRGPIAVFEYRVAQNHSHYSIGQYGPASPAGVAAQPTAYHGEIAVDPVTGAILRLVLQADPPFGSPIFQSNILVQYGPVKLGGKTYVCPLRSVSMGELSLAPEGMDGGAASARWLSDTTFANYHLFRSEMQILTGDAPPQ